MSWPPILSWEKLSGSFFANTCCNSKLYHEWHHSWASSTTGCNFWYVKAVRSWDLVKVQTFCFFILFCFCFFFCFLLIASCIGKRYSRAHGSIVFSSSRHIKWYIHVDLEVMLKPDDIVIFCLSMVSSIVKNLCWRAWLVTRLLYFKVENCMKEKSVRSGTKLCLFLFQSVKYFIASFPRLKLYHKTSLPYSDTILTFCFVFVLWRHVSPDWKKSPPVRRLSVRLGKLNILVLLSCLIHLFLVMKTNEQGSAYYKLRGEKPLVYIVRA